MKKIWIKKRIVFHDAILYLIEAHKDQKREDAAMTYKQISPQVLGWPYSNLLEK